MYPEWVPGYLRENYERTLEKGDLADSSILFVKERIVKAHTLEKFWKKYRSEFESDKDCFIWLFNAVFSSYINFDQSPEYQLTQKEKETKFKELSSMLVKVDRLLREFGMGGSIWYRLPDEYMLKAGGKAAEISGSERVRCNPDKYALLLDLDTILTPLPDMSEFLGGLEERARALAFYSDNLGSPNAANAQLNFFVRSFFNEAKKVCAQPNYERIAELADVFFPDKNVDAIYVRDRVK